VSVSGLNTQRHFLKIEQLFNRFEPMDSKQNEIKVIEDAMWSGFNQQLRDIEGQVPGPVCLQISDLVNFVNLCRGAIEWIQNGFTFEQWMDNQLDQIADSSAVNKYDKIAKRKDLERLTEIVLKIT